MDVLASTARRPALANCSVCCSPEAPSKGSLFNVLASPSRDVQAEVRARGASAPDLRFRQTLHSPNARRITVARSEIQLADRSKH